MNFIPKDGRYVFAHTAHMYLLITDVQCVGVGEPEKYPHTGPWNAGCLRELNLPEAGAGISCKGPIYLRAERMLNNVFGEGKWKVLRYRDWDEVDREPREPQADVRLPNGL